ncbi:hypothetical protein [Nocardia sp. R7R-8]|uniref:hypothetical protein n=1 Tax=Nocardia sp. R7R-8 TaxID=3459304 RepID=UPI00403E19F7
MAEIYKGRRFSTRQEDGKPPLSQEQLDRYAAMFADFNARRNAVPEENRIHLSSRFGDDDFNDQAFNDDGSRKPDHPRPE